MNPKDILKLFFSIGWDIADFTIFRIPAFGTVADIFAIPVAIVLWGNTGLLYAWEVFDITDQFDAQIPTMTLIGILSIIKRGN